MSSPNKPTCTVIHPIETYDGKQEFNCIARISSNNLDASGNSMNLLPMKPGEKAKNICSTVTKPPFI